MTVYLDKRAEETPEETPEETTPTWSIGVVLTVVVAIPLGFMLLWNWLMPVIFSLPAIGYLKSAGLLVMSYILFKR
jgi:hypothetical protein